MNRKHWLLIALVCVFGAGTVAQAQTAIPAGVKVTKVGDTSMLTDAKGMTLYVYDADTAGKSACAGGCAANWPPLAVAEGAKEVGSYTIITRDDGTKQWAYQGKPLYLWKNDKAPLDTTGDGVGGKWHVARP